jgi:RimJ/RimL family protein N-acetyltransferase
MPLNEFGQPIGEPVPAWTPRQAVGPVTLVGRTCRVEPLHEGHVGRLYQALVEQSSPSIWTYIAGGPFTDEAGLAAYVRELGVLPDWAPHVILDGEGTPQGIACYLRIAPGAGSVEVGGITYAAALQRTTAATEAMYLMARHAFEDLGYRRYEWKCDALNAPSRDAALRLGFRYEGLFRQALVYKGRNRDTAWFSITDAEWPALRAAYDAWLEPGNFDADGRQRTPLRARAAD